MRVRRAELVHGAFELMALSDHEWRVSDNRRPECDGLSVVGFIERIGETFEVTRLGDPDAQGCYLSLEQCVDYLQHRSSASDRYL